MRRIARGWPPRAGTPWPLPSCQVEAMSADDVNLLWPDRRCGSRKRRRQLVAGIPVERAVWQRVDATELEMQAQEVQEVHEVAQEESEYVLNEDEDPWHEFD